MSSDYKKNSLLPSVTDILSPWNGYENIPEDKLQVAADRGTAVHAYCSSYAQRIWAPAPPPEYRGYVDSFKRWFDMFVDEVLLCEEELEDPDLGFCGHPDLCVRSAKLGGIILPDLKTPIALHRKAWGCQLSAYSRLIFTGKGIKPNRIGSLRLSSEGKAAKFEDFTENMLAYFRAFVAALDCYKFFKD